MLHKEWFYLPDYQSGIIIVAGKQQRSFAYTYANWREVPSLPREMEYREPDFVSRSGSQYWYTNSGVYRKSDHWGRRIGTCEWYIDGCSYDELVSIIGYCRWDDFVDLERTSMRRDRAAMRRRANLRRAMRKRAESYIDLIIDEDFGEAIVWDDADDYYIEIWRGNDLLETIGGFVSEWDAINYVAENYDYIDPDEELY